MRKRTLKCLRIRTLIPMLSLGICLAPYADAQIDDHLRCYRIKDPLKLRGLVDINTPQFGLAPGCRISTAKLLCVPADKFNEDVLDGSTRLPIDPLLPVSALPAPGDRLCYKVSCRDPGPPDALVTDQFGTRTVGRLKERLLCTPAVKGSEFCGDGVIGAAEACEPADLNGETCESQGFATGTLGCAADCSFDTSGCTEFAFPATGQTTSYLADTNGAQGSAVPDDGAVQAGRPLTYVENGDGTITDFNTGLMWEKKSDDDGLHDRDATFPWSDSAVDTIWDWLAQVNVEGGSGFAGHSDWRIPNAKELQTIIDYERVAPSVDPVFDSSCVAACTVLTCSCTASAFYWSSTTEADGPGAAWGVRFDDGNVETDGKGNVRAVRAVRGGP